MHIILFIIVLAAIIFFLLLTFALRIVSTLVGGLTNLWNIITGKGINAQQSRSSHAYGNNTTNSTAYSTNQYSSNNHSNASASHHQHGEKVFKADEGEYVDFEEIKN
jgi:hypothetical protein